MTQAPTPALGGFPRADALELIAREEGFTRGRYGGAVGWVDAAGDGVWAVAIRCAELSADRRSARLVAGLATRSREVTVTDLAGADRGAWGQLRAELEHRRERRVERRQFRRDPHGYLKALEHKLNQSRLPA